MSHGKTRKKPLTLSIRPARLADVSLLLAMNRRFAADTGETPPPTRAAMLRQALFGKRRCGQAYIARIGGQPAGYAALAEHADFSWGVRMTYLSDLYVVARFRRLGVADALLRQMACVCVRQRSPLLYWGVVRRNKRAYRFYEAMGARHATKSSQMYLLDKDLVTLAVKPAARRRTRPIRPRKERA